MNLLIAHHHLGPGGVTRVVANHLLAIDAAVDGPVRVGLLYDGDRSGLPDVDLANAEVTHIPVEGIGYADGGDGTALADRTEAAARTNGFAGSPIHVHNHSLGKNPAWSEAVRMLADRGWAMLLQCHDFAEDYRPANYRRLTGQLGDRLSETLYFSSDRVHLAVLNGRDYGVLAAAGVPEDRLGFLPNPVPPMPEPGDKAEARREVESQLDVSPDAAYWLYPVRGIRRKNVGEMCLLAAAGRGRVVPAITLAPANPKEKPFFEHWQSVAADQSLPCRFGVGDVGLSFEENLTAADRVMTTSVAEGFGMVFLEAWLAGRPLVGRDLPEITRDFKEAGLDLGSLTERVNIPTDWFDSGEYVDLLHAAAMSLASDYGRPAVSREDAEQSFDRRTTAWGIDFADLDERLQTDVIRRVATDADAAERVFGQWPDGDESVVPTNAKVVASEYDLLATGRRLLKTYEAITAGGATTPDVADGAEVIEQFQSIDRLRLIRM